MKLYKGPINVTLKLAFFQGVCERQQIYRNMKQFKMNPDKNDIQFPNEFQVITATL